MRRGNSDGSSGPRGLTVNESEGPQEHDPGQPESARSETGRTAHGVAPRPRRRPRLGARIPGLPPPQRLLRRSHRGAASAHAHEAPRARTPRPEWEASPVPAGHAHGRGARSKSERARPPQAARRAAAVRARGGYLGGPTCTGKGLTCLLICAFISLCCRSSRRTFLPRRLPSWTLTLWLLEILCLAGTGVGLVSVRVGSRGPLLVLHSLCVPLRCMESHSSRGRVRAVASLGGSRLPLPAQSVWPGVSQVSPSHVLISAVPEGCWRDSHTASEEKHGQQLGPELQPDPSAQVSKAPSGSTPTSSPDCTPSPLGKVMH